MEYLDAEIAKRVFNLPLVQDGAGKLKILFVCTLTGAQELQSIPPYSSSQKEAEAVMWWLKSRSMVPGLNREMREYECTQLKVKSWPRTEITPRPYVPRP